MADFSKIKSIAETYRKLFVEDIKEKVSGKSKKLARLAYLFLTWQEENEKLHPPQTIKRTDLKTAIFDNYQSDQLTEYFSDLGKGECHRNFINTLSTWKKTQDKYCDDKSGLTVAEFIKMNQSNIPFEIAELMKSKDTKEVTTGDEEKLSGIILGILYVVNDLEDLIEKAINDDKISPEEWEEIKLLMGTKIRWVGKLNEFAFFINRLFNNGFIEIPPSGSSPKKADLLYAHFYVGGHNGKESTIRSLKDAINNSEDSPNINEKFKSVFK